MPSQYDSFGGRYDGVSIPCAHLSSPTTLLFTNRINNHPNLIPGLGFKTVSTYAEYINTVHKTKYRGFFYIGEQLCCYMSYMSEIEVSTEVGSIPLLFFCDKYEYEFYANPLPDGAIGAATLYTKQYPPIEIHLFNKLSTIVNKSRYTYSVTSRYDPNPINKIPGEPIYKSFKINAYRSSIKKVKISGTEIDMSQTNTVVSGSDERFYLSYIAYKHVGSGIIEVGFTLPLDSDILKETEFDISYCENDTWSEPETFMVSFVDNDISELKETIKVSVNNVHAGVPKVYTLKADNKYYLQRPNAIKQTKVYHVTGNVAIPLIYKTFSENKHIYMTDSFSIPTPLKGATTSNRFVISDTYSKINGFSIPVWLTGRSDIVEIASENRITVTPEIMDELIYEEYDSDTYELVFTWTGNVNLKSVKLKRVTDIYGYFSTIDFKLKEVRIDDTKLVYNLVIDKKIFVNPIDINTVPLSILFDYTVECPNGDIIQWPAETLHTDIEIIYVKDRWEIVFADIKNTRLGENKITYRIKDKLLGKVTEKYPSDVRLKIVGDMEFSPNVTKIDEKMLWCMKDKCWISTVMVSEYGSITLQFKGVQSESNIYTLEYHHP